MSSNWINALDACAAGGILNYDAAADLLEQPARFVGHPNFETLQPITSDLLPNGTQIKTQPKSDEFNNSNNLVENPSWKKWLFGGIVATAIGGSILTALISKGKIKMPKLSGLTTSLKNIATKTLNIIKKPFTFIASKIKRTP